MLDLELGDMILNWCNNSFNKLRQLQLMDNYLSIIIFALIDHRYEFFLQI